MVSVINLEKYIKNRKCTLLGVGPMSLNCIDATIELAEEHKSPLMMIASRRQIDSKQFGGGYVNNWNSENLSQYLKKNDLNSNILLSRDHGGPYQNNLEVENKLSLEEAMVSAKKSFADDIANDFKIIHIDPSIDINEELSHEKIFERLIELYEFCIETANRLKKEIIIEIGTEEQSGGINTLEELNISLEKITNFCEKKRYQKPFFIVVQTGTKVMENKNVGTFDNVFNNFENSIVPSLLKLCQKYSINIKQHNTDYLPDNHLMKHPQFGIQSANVAPEFGVCETLELLKIIDHYQLKKIKDELIELCVDSNKWFKWAIDPKNIDPLQKTILSGHYLFANKKFLELKKRISIESKIDEHELNRSLKNTVKKSIYRYMKNFNLLAK